MKANWRLVRVTEDGEPIVNPDCPRCKTDLNNPYYCTECGAKFDDDSLFKFFNKHDVYMSVYDECEQHDDCTVQILHNSITGEYSIGWWENKHDE